MSIREPELEIAARIGITPKAYRVLRKLKVERQQSMVRIVSDLVLKEAREKDGDVRHSPNPTACV